MTITMGGRFNPRRGAGGWNATVRADVVVSVRPRGARPQRRTPRQSSTRDPSSTARTTAAG